MKLPTLPPYYYLDHFRELLAFVSTTYAAVLDDEHLSFISRFNGFSKDAKCLLIRMINRKGEVFDRDRLTYAEIGRVDLALDELRASGHVRSLQLMDYSAFLSGLSKDKLLHAARVAGFNPKTSWSKPKLIAFFETDIAYDRAVGPCGGDRHVVLDNIQPVQFLLYLYFGKTKVDLKNFALRDLGVIRTNDASSFSARFGDAEEARACFYYSQLLDRIGVESRVVYEVVANDLLNGPSCPADFASDLASKVALDTGRFFEKCGDDTLAERLFRLGTSTECHERLVRILYRKGEKDAVEVLLKQMIDDPASDEEHLFANDFYARKFGGKRQGLHTELLRAARTIVIDDTHRGNPEAGVASVMRRQGATVFFAENTLWLSLFGLLFWDELFESGQLAQWF